MAIAIDSGGSPFVQVGTAFAPTVTISNVVVSAGSDRFLIVGVAWTADSTEPTVTYGGVSMTKISPATSPAFSGFRVAAFGLDDPAVGTANVVVTSGQAEFTASAAAVAWSGVSGATGWVSTTSTDNTPSIDVLSVAAGEVTIDVLGHLATNIAVGAGSGTQNVIADTTVGGVGAFGMSYDSGSSGTVPMNWTSDVDDAVIGGFRLQVAAAAAGVPFTPAYRFSRGRKAQKRRRAA